MVCLFHLSAAGVFRQCKRACALQVAGQGRESQEQSEGREAELGHHVQIVIVGEIDGIPGGDLLISQEAGLVGAETTTGDRVGGDQG